MATIHISVDTTLDGEASHSFSVKWFSFEGYRLEAFFDTRHQAEQYAKNLKDELPRSDAHLQVTSIAADVARSRSRRRRKRKPLAAQSGS